MHWTSGQVRSLALTLVVASFMIAGCGRSTLSAPARTTLAPATAEVALAASAPDETPVASAKMSIRALPSRSPSEGPVLNPSISGAVEVWHFWGSPVRHNAFRRVIAMCQQQLPNITINETVKPFGEIWAANLAAVAAGTGMPDVIISNRPTLPREAEDGVYRSLQEWADGDNVRREQFYNWAWDQGIYNGETYGIPHETDVRVLFYNKNLFRQAGLDPDKPPKTWAELEVYANKLDKIGPDGKLERVAFFPLWGNLGADMWQYMNGAEMIRPDGTPQINNPKMIETVEWVKKWVDRYGGWDKLQAFHAQFGGPPDDIFMSSGVAMSVDIFGYNSQLQFYRPRVKLDDGEEVRMEWGIAPLPYSSKPGTWSGGFAMSIPAGAQNPEAAWEFIKCATSSAAQVSWARDTQAQPTNLEAAKDPSLLADPAWAIVDEALRSSTGGVYVARYPNWTEQLTQRWEMVWRGELSPARMLDEAQRAVEEAIQ